MVLKRVLKLAEWIGTLVFAVAILAVALMFVGPRFGWDTHPVLSGSMEPALKVGGVIVTRPIALDEVKVGDIITFQIGNQRVTHRVVEIVHKEGENRPWFRTKGDANQGPDANLVSSNGRWVAKTVAYVPYLGYIASAVKSKTGFWALVGVPAFVLTVLAFREIWQGILEEKAKRSQKTSKAGV